MIVFHYILTLLRLKHDYVKPTLFYNINANNKLYCRLSYENNLFLIDTITNGIIQEKIQYSFQMDFLHIFHVKIIFLPCLVITMITRIKEVYFVLAM